MTRLSLRTVLLVTRYSLLITALLLVACVPAPAATPTTTSGNGGLTQTASSEDGSLTVNYPEGWIVQANPGEIRLANSADTLENTEAVPAEGIALSILVLPSELLPTMAISSQVTLSDPPTAAEVLGIFHALAVSDAQATIGEPTPLTIGGRNAARASITLPNNADGEVTVLDLGNGAFATISVGAGTGFLAPNRALIDQIIETITYTAPDLNGTPTPSG